MDCSTWDSCEWKSSEKALLGVKSLIRTVPDFPQKGIMFQDIMPLFQVPNAVNAVANMMTEYILSSFPSVDAIIALDARGFLIGPMVAVKLSKPFIPIEKKGKLPGGCYSVTSTKEYGHDVLEIQKEALRDRQKVVIIDDLLATGGTLHASCELVEKAGAVVLGTLCLIELVDLNGRIKLKNPFHAFIQS